MKGASKQTSAVADPGISKPGARSRRGGILRSGVCFDAPSQIHIVNIVYELKINVYACYAVKIYKNNPPKKFQTGGRARRAGP